LADGQQASGKRTQPANQGFKAPFVQGYCKASLSSHR
jgi:hypothetical protein